MRNAFQKFIESQLSLDGFAGFSYGAHPFGTTALGCALAIFAACVPVRSFPPICDLAELDVPEGVDGKSLARILKGEETKVCYVQVPVLE